MRPATAALLLVVVARAAAPAGAADPQAAERQYRVARRLAAEGAPEADAALRRVAELDPQGPLADDVLVDRARLAGAAGWPEELGGITGGPSRSAAALLGEALASFPDGDRAAEAGYLSGLLRLEPLAGHDPSAARVALVRVATAPRANADWTARARYALGWLDEHGGRLRQAAAAYTRLIVERQPDDPAASRARVGLARLRLRAGASGEAAGLLQEAIDVGVPAECGAVPLREQAMRAILGRPGRGATSAGQRRETGLRGVVGLAAMPDGGVAIAAGRDGRVVRFGPTGVETAAWVLRDVAAIAADPRGRIVAVAGDGIVRLDAGGGLTTLGRTGAFSPVDSIAGDVLGGVWLLDRRGRIGRLDPGASEPRPFWEDRSLRLQSLAWDGQRLAAVDVRNRRLVAIDRAGAAARTVLEAGLVRPVAVAADPSGRLALLDVRAGFVLFVNAEGRSEEAFAYAPAGVENPEAVGLGADGVLHLFDAAGGAWYRTP